MGRKLECLSGEFLELLVNFTSTSQASDLQDALVVSKRILLFCCNQSPQLVVDELMSECAQLINDEEACPVGPQRKLSSVATFHAQVRHEANLHTIQHYALLL